MRESFLWHPMAAALTRQRVHSRTPDHVLDITHSLYLVLGITLFPVALDFSFLFDLSVTDVQVRIAKSAFNDRD